jgi:glycine/D-amino acid oxidase-like deaminating enzyme
VGRFTTAGGRLLTGAGEARPVVAGDRAQAVRLADGTRIDADRVVVATGAAVPDLLGELGVPIHAQHSPAALVRTRPVDAGLRVVVNAPRASLRPTPDGCLVVGAGWLDAELADDGRTVPEERIPELLAEASAVLEGRSALVAAEVGRSTQPSPGLT